MRSNYPEAESDAKDARQAEVLRLLRNISMQYIILTKLIETEG